MLSDLSSLPIKTEGFFFPERITPLHAMLTNCGHNIEYSTNYRWDGMMRGPKSLAIWQYTVSGEGALLYKGQEYRLPAGHAMMVEVPQKSTYFFPPGSESWEFLFISLNGSEVMRLWRDAVKQNGPVVNLGDNSEPVMTALKLIRNGFAGRINNPYIASAFAYEFVLSLVAYILPQGNRGQERPEFLNDVISYCLEHPDGDLSVDVLAEVAGYSRYHFSREFHRFQGMPPAEFVNQLRIKLAVRLLQTEKFSVKEIADRCGFNSASYFSKVFRKYQGIAPGDFRSSR